MQWDSGITTPMAMPKLGLKFSMRLRIILKRNDLHRMAFLRQ